MAEVNTRSGIRPRQSQTLRFSITTQDVEKYLQEKIDALYGKVKADTKGRVNKHVDVNVVTADIGRNYKPFIVVLPISALAEKSEDDSPFSGIFDPKSGDGTTKLDPILSNLFTLYSYTSEDVKGFTSESIRHHLGIPRKNVSKIKFLSSPKMTKLEATDEDQKIIFLQDPIKIFFDMLKIENDNRPYVTDIVRMQKIRTGNFQYTIERSNNKKRKNRNNNGNDLPTKMQRYLERGVR